MSAIIDPTRPHHRRAVRRRRGRRAARAGRAGLRAARLPSPGGRKRPRTTCSCRRAAARRPASAETVDAREHYLRQNGKAVFKFAVSPDGRLHRAPCSRATSSPPHDIAMVIPHQANQRILDATADRLGLPRERMASVIARYGNTTAATLPLALEDVVRCGKAHTGATWWSSWRWAPASRGGDAWCGGVGVSGAAQARENSAASMAARSRVGESEHPAPRPRTLSSACSTVRALGITMTAGRLRQHPGQHQRVGRHAEPARRSAASTGWSGSLRLSRPPPIGL